MPTKKIVTNYFESNANAWMTDAYSQSGYNYPTPKHRLRILNNIFNELNDVKELLDVGCGGGDVAIDLAKTGFNVTGVDESEAMLKAAKVKLSAESNKLVGNVKFVRESLQNLGKTDFDAMTAMGVVGYLPSDEYLFEVADRSVRSGGYAIFSFRNRLFNLFSLSNRTLKEVKSGTFEKLANEVLETRKDVSEKSAREVIEALHEVTGTLLKNGDFSASEKIPSEEKGLSYEGCIEARQSTPAEVEAAAKIHGFEVEKHIGVHPHWLSPSMNECLPPKVYNMISDCLLPLENSSNSLAWSSVFISVCKKQS